MRDFVYHAPTEVVFGKQSEEKVAGLVKKYGGHKVLVHYGGKSAQKSGLLDKICGLLRDGGVDFVCLGGVVPNPRLSLVHQGIDLCRQEGVDFILAIGGGSVIDSAKAIACGVPYDGEVWDFYLGKASPKCYLPVACVLTIPAAGSEMSESSVITNEDGDVKLTDMIMHTMERYFSHDDDMDLTDAIAEALMRDLMDNVFKVLADPEDYRARAQIMWGGSLAHNDLTGCGLTGDWATHEIEHELSGMFDVTHGAGLAAIWPSWARYVYKENVSRFVRFAVNVLGVNVLGVPQDFTDPEGTAIKGIEAMERFYHAIGMPINIHELIGKEVSEDEIKEMARKCTRGHKITQGSFKVLGSEDIEAIYRMAR